VCHGGSCHCGGADRGDNVARVVLVSYRPWCEKETCGGVSIVSAVVTS
jgi:hypothetical protein